MVSGAVKAPKEDKDMRKVTFLIVAAVLVSGGVYLAFSPADRDQPADPQPSAMPEPVAGEEPLGLCTIGAPLCNSGSCTGPGCGETCDMTEHDTGWTKCCDNNQMVDCSPGTVHYINCACDADGGGFCASGSVRRYGC